MWKVSAFYISAGDALFSPMMSGKPLQSILLSVGARALFGLAAGYLYRAVRRSRHPYIGIFLVASVGSRLHAFLVYGFMEFLFPEAGFHITDTFHDIWNWDTLLFALVLGLLVLFCCWCLNTDQAKRYSERIRMADQVQMGVTHNKKTIAAAIVTIFIASFSVAWYFTNRIESVMSQYGIYLSDEISYDITHLQIQFLLGIISLFALAILAIILHFKNVNYLYYEAKLDGLTGLASRDQFSGLGKIY